jgi:hypothetical protein
MRFATAYKLVAAVLAAIIVTALASGGVVLAAENSLPGETLYPVKLALEDARLRWATGPVDQAALNLAFAGERVQEMERLVAAAEGVPAHTLQRMAQHTEQAMAQIASVHPQEVAPLLEQAMTSTQEQLRAMERLQNGLQSGEEQEAWRHAYQVAERARLALDAAQGDPARFQQQYQHRYQGTPAEDPIQNREREQNRVEETPAPQRQQEREQNRAGETPTPERQQERGREQNRAGETPTPERQQEREQNRAEETPTPQREQEREHEGAQMTPAEPTPHQNRYQEQDGPQDPAAPTPVPPTPHQHQEQNGAQVTPVQGGKK